jgi:hypothetical protein
LYKTGNVFKLGFLPHSFFFIYACVPYFIIIACQQMQASFAINLGMSGESRKTGRSVQPNRAEIDADLDFKL